MRSSTHRDPARTLHVAADLRRALTALSVYVALGAWADGRPGRRERRVFGKVNHDTDRQPLLRVPQQLGTPWVLPGLAVLGFLTHRPHLAVTAAAALPLEKALEVGVKKLFHRDRPSKADPRADLEDDAPVEGSSDPSGHAGIAFTAVLLTAPYLPGPVNALGLLNASLASWVRLRQGAHFPADALGGVLLAVTVSSGLQALFGRPADPEPLLPRRG
jgi:membrane-associated phospholipid phosphatase